MPTTTNIAQGVRLPPRWFIRTFWAVQRAIYRTTRRSLKRATTDKEGWLAVQSVGRHTGAERTAILAYFEDGPNLVTMAMNGWAEADPAWWLNLQAHPDATVALVDGPRAVHARAAVGEERNRLWTRWGHYDKDLDQYAAMRSRETAVVVFEPRAESAA